MNTILKHGRWVLGLLATVLLNPAVGWAQTPTLEFTDGAGNPSTAPANPVTTQAITFQNNTDNPSANNTFAAFSPAITATFTLSNQMNTTTKVISGSSVSTAIGATSQNGNASAIASPIFPLMNSLSLTTDANPSFYTSVSGVTGGIDIAKNRSVRFFTSVEGIADNASTANTARYQTADVTITFSQPVVNPVLQITGLGGTRSNTTATGTLGFSTEFELVTTGVTLSKLSGSSTLGVTSTQIRNNATTFTATTSTTSGATTGAASGSILVTTPATGITSLTFTMYLRGDGGSSIWHDPNNTAAGHGADGWQMGVSMGTYDLSTTLTGPGGVASATAAGPYSVTFANNGPGVAPTVTRQVTLTVNNNGTHPAANTVTVNGAAYTATSGVSYSASTGVLNFGNVTNMASNTSNTFEFGYTTPTYAATTAASVSVTASTALTGATEANTANNTATVTSNIQNTGAIDMAINISGLNSATAPSTASAGDFAYYIVTLTNVTSGNAANTNLTIQLPTGYTEVSASGNYTYNPATGQIVANFSPFGNGSYSIRVRMRVPASGPYTIKAYSTSDTADPTPGNNDGNSTSGTYINQVTTAVTQSADVVTTVNGPNQASPNQLIAYNVLSTNYGPSTATGVLTSLVLGGTVPANASDVTVTDANGAVVPGATYSPSTKTVMLTSTGTTLATGASQSYVVRFRAPATGSVSGKASNTATTTTVAPNYGDPTPGNNDGSAGDANITTTVVAASALASGQCASFPAPAVNASFDGTTSINTYYAGLKAPDNQSAVNTSGQKVISLNLAAPVPSSGASAIAAGDLIMIIQMQGADISVSNNNSYGNGYTGDPGNGQLSNSNYTAGLYEYATVASVSTATNTINLNFNLTNSYVSADYNSTAQTGQRRFQVIRLPRYQTLTLSSDVTNVPAWNGSTGGVLAVDIAGRLDLNGRTISLKGKGFRGGAGQQLSTGGTGTAGDYYSAAPANATTTTGVNGSKGEGIAGTPRYVNNGGTILDNSVEGYPSGSYGRGAPGNAGGGGSDSDIGGNSENSGGGGGSNAGTGGSGGDNWNSNYPYGGNGGAPFLQASPSRLVMGGGGGAGSTNNGTVSGTKNTSNVVTASSYPANVGLSTNGFASSGAAGGGMVFIRASTVSANTGTIDVSGNDMAYVPENDGSGGGGGGGSVLLLANNGVSLSAITVLATGGKGGSNTGGGVAHGPGGGGSGGIILTSAAISTSSSNLGGINGNTNILTGSPIPYGSTTGTTGTPPRRADVTAGETPLLEAAANCVADVTTTISGGSTSINAGQATTNFTIAFTNNGPLSAAGVTEAVTLPTGASLTTAQQNAITAAYPGTTFATTGSGNSAVTTVTFTGTGSKNLANSATDTYQLSFTAPTTNGSGTGYALTSNVATTTNESDASNNSATQALTDIATADVTTTISAPTSVAPGQATGNYTFSFTNNGPQDAAGVAETVTLPTGASLTTAQQATIKGLTGATNATFATTGSGTTAVTVISFQGSGNTKALTSGTTDSYTFAFTAPSTVAPAYSIVSNVATTSNQGNNLAPDQAQGLLTVENPRSDLSTTIASNPTTGSSVNAGALVPYTVTATNNTGTNLSAASNVVQTVQLQPGLVGPGTAATATATLTVANAAYSSTSGSVITFTNTAGGTGTTVASYDATSGLLSFPAASIALGATTTYPSFSAVAPVSGPFAVVATVGNGTVDPTPANNTASTTLNVTPRYDIGTTITGPSTAPPAGSPLTYMVTATDAGTTPALGVLQTLNLGTGRTQVHATNGGYYNGTTSDVKGDFVNSVFVPSTTGAVTVTAGYVFFPPVDLMSGQTVNNTVTFAAPTSGSTVAPVSSFTSASLTNDTNNTGAGVNSATAPTLTISQAAGTATTTTNLRTTLTATNSSGTNVASAMVAANTVITYSAVLTNDGPIAAAAAQETISLPAGLAAISSSLPGSLAITGSTGNTSAVVNGQTVITYTGGNYPGTTYNTSTGMLTFPSITSLAANSSPTYAYGFSLTAPTAATAVNVMAMAATTTSEASLDDNVAQVSTNLTPTPDPTISVVGPTAATAGQTVTYEMTTSNTSTFAAQQVVPTVSVPAGLPLSTSASGNTLRLNGNVPTSISAASVATYADGSTYDAATGLITLPVLATMTGTQAQLTTVRFPAPGTTYAVVASVRSASADSNPTNNSSTVTATVAAAADVVASVSGPATIVAGSTVTYAATVTNNGTSVATGATVPTLQLPAGLAVSTTHPGLRLNGLLPSAVATNNGVTIATYTDAANNTMTYNQNTGLVTFASITDLASGAANAVTNTVTFDAPSTNSFVVTAAAAPASTANDLNLDNNWASVTTTENPALTTVDLSVTAVPSIGGTATTTATAGQRLTYTVTTQNLSTTTSATNARTQITVAPGQPTTGVNAISINGQTAALGSSNGVVMYGDGSTYTPATGRVDFPVIATAAAGYTNASAPFTVVLSAPPAGTLNGLASVRSDNFESNTLNNFDSEPVTITPNADLTATVTGPATTSAGSTVTYTVTTTNLAPTTAGGLGGSPAVGATQTISIPANAATGTPAITGPGAASAAITGSASTGYTITIPLGTLAVGPASAAVNTVSFTVGSSITSPFVVKGAASTSGTGATTDPNTANNSGTAAQQQSTAVAPTGPLAADIVNNGRTGTNAGQSPIGNTGGVTAITSLAATALGTGNSIASYTITSLPAVGVLYVNNSPVTSLPSGGLSVTLANSALLTYDPTVTGPQGTTAPSTLDASNQFFTFTATDNNGVVSNVARYTIPVNQDASTVYTVNSPKGATVAYTNGTEIARAFDYNGGKATTAAIFTADPITATSTTSNGNATNMPNNGVRAAVENSFTTVSSAFGNFTSLASLGLAISATTGQITVTDATKLRTGNYKVNVTTTDAYGGVTTQDVAFSIGTNPLPVSLTVFTAQAVSNRDGLLKWTTASETNNDHFNIERSFDGASFTKIGQVAGQGTKLTATDYTLTDAGVAAKATGLVYYRLQQVDVNGTTAYSPVRTVSFTATATATLGLYPSPATTSTTLDLSQLPTTGTYQVVLLDVTGRSVRTWTLAGGQPQTLELTDVATGSYLLQVAGTQPDGSALHQTLRLTKN